MLLRYKPTAASLTLPTAASLTLLTLFVLSIGGCGGGDDATTTASIEAPEDGAETDEPTGGNPPEPPEEVAQPIVLLQTTMGDIKLRLEREKVPQTVDNFLKYVDSGHYNHTIFHQVVKGQPSVLIGGMLTDTRTEKPLAAANTIYCDAFKGLSNQRGTIAMTRLPSDPHSATCGFFINVTDNQQAFDSTPGDKPENYGYCAFGTVIEGIEVVDKIAAVETEDAPGLDRTPVAPLVVILSARVIK